MEELEISLESSGLPFRYHHWESKPPLPFGVFLFPNSDHFKADGYVFFSQEIVRVEIYTTIKSSQIEQKIESLLDTAEIFYERNEEYIESEKMYQISYEFELEVLNNA